MVTKGADRPLTKSQTAAALAKSVEGVSKKQAKQILACLAKLACQNAKNSFTIPGLGKLVLVDRKERVGRNPATGAPIQIKAKRLVKFKVAKEARQAILGEKA